MKTLLVTGGAGFIGANFVHYWMEAYPNDRVVVLDALTYAGSLSNLDSVKESPNFVFCHGDICDTTLVEALLKEHRINTLVHFAAESHVDRSIDGPDAFIETNIIGTHSLLKAAKKIWIDEPKAEGKKPLDHRFHHVSTDEVYGALEVNAPAFTEETQYAPNSPYSASKAASDHLVRAYHHTFGLEVTTSNCSNNYGPYHFPEKLIPLVITNILRNKTLPIYGDGLQIRDWLYVADHARGIDLIIHKGLSGERYNLGGINEWTNIDVVRLICNVMNERFEFDPRLKYLYPDASKAALGKSEELLSYVTDRVGHDRRYAIQPDKSYEELNFKPIESFKTGLEKTVDWYLNNRAWWKNYENN